MDLFKVIHEKTLDEGKIEEVVEYELRLNLTNLDNIIKKILLIEDDKAEAAKLKIICRYGEAMEMTEGIDFPCLVIILGIDSDKPKQRALESFLARNLGSDDLVEEWAYSADVFKLTNLKLKLLLQHSKESMGDDATIQTLKEEPKESSKEEAAAKEHLDYRPLIVAVEPSTEESVKIAELLRSLVYLFDWDVAKKKELIQFIKDGKWWPSDWLNPTTTVNKLSPSEHSRKDKPIQKKSDYITMDRDRAQQLARTLRMLIVSGITGKLVFDKTEDSDFLSQLFKTETEILLFDYWDLLFELVILGHKEPYETKLPMTIQSLKAALTEKGRFIKYEPDTINGRNDQKANKFIGQVDTVLKSIQDARMPIELARLFFEPQMVGKDKQTKIFLIGGPIEGDELRSRMYTELSDGKLTWRTAKAIIEADAQVQEAKARANQEDKQVIISRTERSIRQKEKEQKDKRDSPKGAVNQLSAVAPATYQCPICGAKGHYGVNASGTELICPDYKKNPKKYESDAKQIVVKDVLKKRKDIADSKAAAGGGSGRQVKPSG